METVSEMRKKVVGKAVTDADFRARLLSDPKGAVGQELGITIAEFMSIEVHEESATSAHLVLPPTADLGKEDLEAAFGGRDIIDLFFPHKRPW